MRVIRAVDLSLPIEPESQVYPGDPPVEIGIEATVADGGFNVRRMAFGSHTGTHCDAPYHVDDAGARIDELDLRLFTGPGVVLDVRHRRDRELITLADLTPQLHRLAAGDILLLHTGWTRHYRTARYFDHPYLAQDACQAVLETGVRVLGVDTLSLDETTDEQHPGVGWPCHQRVLGAGGVLIENLTNLDRIDFTDPFVCALPLRLAGSDGSPVRAVALELHRG
jgi:kynurenine formamidase